MGFYYTTDTLLGLGKLYINGAAAFERPGAVAAAPPFNLSFRKFVRSFVTKDFPLIILKLFSQIFTGNSKTILQVHNLVRILLEKKWKFEAFH